MLVCVGIKNDLQKKNFIFYVRKKNLKNQALTKDTWVKVLYYSK